MNCANVRRGSQVYIHSITASLQRAMPRQIGMLCLRHTSAHEIRRLPRRLRGPGPPARHLSLSAPIRQCPAVAQ